MYNFTSLIYFYYTFILFTKINKDQSWKEYHRIIYYKIKHDKLSFKQRFKCYTLRIKCFAATQTKRLYQ